MPVPPAKIIIFPGFFSCKANPDPLAQLTLISELKSEEIRSDVKYPSLYLFMSKGSDWLNYLFSKAYFRSVFSPPLLI